ncbi:MAG: type II secretion system protein [Kiritimatiellia bacterium]
MTAKGTRAGFTLVEMLVVIGIITVLVGASLGGYSAMTRSAERAKCQELVANTATALTALFQQEGHWPKKLRENGSGDGELNEDVAYALVAGSTKYMSLSTKDGKLSGLDRFGIVTPWATAALKNRGASASLSTKVGSATVKDHILRFALDLDGDGIIEGVNVGGKSINIRATAAVWCCGKDGVISPYPYDGSGGGGGKGASGGQAGGKGDDVYSWTPGQTRSVK